MMTISAVFPVQLQRTCHLSWCGVHTESEHQLRLWSSLPVSSWANIYGFLTIHASQTFVNLCRTVAFRSQKLLTSLLLIGIGLRTYTTPAIWDWHCVKRTWLVGASVILVELDSVPTRWVRHGTLPVATIKRKKEKERHYERVLISP